MRLKTISEGNLLNTAGHAALDIGGFVPGYGEPADLANALWYIGEGEYFSAAMSVLSMIPDVGDVIGKGMKYLGKSSTKVAEFITKYGPVITKYWGKALELIKKSEKLRPHARALDDAVKQYLANNRQTQTTQTQAVQ